MIPKEEHYAPVVVAPTRPVASKRHSYQQPHLNFGVNPSLRTVSGVTAGCYTPTGSIRLPKSKFYQQWQRGQSVASQASQASTLSKKLSEDDSDDSKASSLYGDVQAAEIEEEEMRGRRRSRGLDWLRLDDMEAQGRTICAGA